MRKASHLWLFHSLLAVVAAQNAVLQDTLVVFSSNTTVFLASPTYMAVFGQQIATYFNVQPSQVATTTANVASGQFDLNYVINIPCGDPSISNVQNKLNSGCCSGLVKIIGQVQNGLGAPIWGLKRVSAPPTLVGTCISTTTTTTVVAATLVDTLVVLSTDSVAFASNTVYLAGAVNQIASFFQIPASYVSVAAVNVIVDQQLDLRYTISLPCSDTNSIATIQTVLSNNCCGDLVKSVGLAQVSLGARLTAMKRTSGPPALTGTCITPVAPTSVIAAVLQDRLTVVTNTPSAFKASSTYLAALASQVASFYSVQPSYVTYVVRNVLNNQLDVKYNVTIPCSDTISLSQVISILNNNCCARLVDMVGKAVVGAGAAITAIKRSSGAPGLYGPCGPLGIVTDTLMFYTADPSSLAYNSAYMNAVTSQLASFFNVAQSYVSVTPGTILRSRVDVNYTIAVPCYETPPMLSVLQNGCCAELLDYVAEAEIAIGAPVKAIKRNSGPPVVNGPCSAPSVLQDTLTILTGDPYDFASNPSYMAIISQQLSSFYGVNMTIVSLTPTNFQARQFDVMYNLSISCGDRDTVNNVVDVLSNGCCSALVTNIGRAEVAAGSGILAVKRRSSLPSFNGPCAPRIVTTATTTPRIMSGSERGHVQVATLCLASGLALYSF